MSRVLVVAAAQLGPIPRSQSRQEAVARLVAMMEEARRMGTDLVVQGNLDPVLALAGTEAALRGADAVLASNAGHPGHIFNLGHGVMPTTDPGLLAQLVDYVHETTAGANHG